MTDPRDREARIDTRAVHAGADPDAVAGSIVTPIFQSSTFAYPSGDRELLYTRYGNNPSQEALQRKVASLEGTEASLALASGMAAIATGILSTCASGDHVVAAPALYGGTHALLQRDLDRVHDRRDPDLPRLGAEPAALQEQRG